MASTSDPTDTSANGPQLPMSQPRGLAPAIYGIIVSASVMAASAQFPRVARVVVAVLVTVLIYWIAERYAEILAAGVRGHHLNAQAVRRVLREGWPMVEATYAPLVVLIVAALLGASTELAVTIAMIFSTWLLLSLGWLSGRRVGLTGWPLIAVTLIAGLLGVALILLKFTLH